ncbi:MAG: bacteriochlorophyll 4-vinyl reductase [Gemmatimonadales bacterium]
MTDLPFDGLRTEGARLIGPNALIQTAAALDELESGSVEAILLDAGELAVRGHPQDDMVDERRFAVLVTTLVRHLGEERAERVLMRSGSLAADYLMVHGIPPTFQWLLRRLPRDLGLRLLLGAVASQTWTFAGSGRFRYELPGDGLVELAVDDCPACRGLVTQHPVCGYYTGIFERLFRMLVDDRMRVREAGCHACGGGNCVLLGKPEVEQGY